MLTTEEHAALLRSFAVDRLLQLVTLEAKRRHDGHVTIVALTTQYQVAFGPPTLSPGAVGSASATKNNDIRFIEAPFRLLICCIHWCYSVNQLNSELA